MTSLLFGNGSDPDAKRRGKREVEVRTDAPSRTATLVADLRARGFTRIKQTTIAADELRTARIAVLPGPLVESEIDVAELLIAVDAFVRAEGVDRGRYPIQRLATEVSSPVITLPLDACLARLRPSYAGADPDRYLVRVESDDRVRSQLIVDGLREQGFRAIRRAIRLDTPGFAIRCPKGDGAIAFIEPIRRAMEQAIREVAGEEEAEYGIDLIQDDTDLVTAVLPLSALASGGLMEKLSAPDRFDCVVYAADPDSPIAASVRRELSGLGFRSLSIKRPEARHGGTIAYGGAPSSLVRRVQKLVADALQGVTLRLDQKWPKQDNDIWVYLPSDLSTAPAAIAPVALPTTASTAGLPSAGRSFVTIRDDHVAVGRHVLPRRRPHALSPDPTPFASYVLDQPTAENLDHIAASILAGEPCLLEGPTATSKTSAMMFLASLLGQGVIRVNLNGQTDTAELIGRYEPIGREWRWSPGAVPRAMREGLWLMLDEINLCDPNVIERLNSVLESWPSLYLGEFDGSVIGGPGGEPVHTDFRVLASLNPTDGYVGRSSLSPALRDRFVGFRRARHADAADIVGQLNFMLRGMEPAVVIDGLLYPGTASGERACCGDLGRRLPDLEALIAAMARFHVGAETACAAQGGSGDRPVVTRRSLLACVGHLDAHRPSAATDWPAILWRGIERYYLARVADPTLRASLVALATATGIGPDRWSFK
ncbi:MAG: AAA family ATPase [Alphaproteobacteria bacterium]|nr:AAA family ATPase [Alphaproteobacteria bacterium]